MTDDACNTEFGRFIFEREAWYRQRRAGTSSGTEQPCAGGAGAPDGDGVRDASAGCVPETADDAFAREIALAREVVYPVPADVPIPSCGDCCEPLDGRESCTCLQHEVCDDERDADAAVGVMPPAALVYAEPGGVA